MGAAFLCAIAGIANEHTDRNTSAYIQNWIEKLEEDNRLIVHAAANAQRAVDMILGSTFEEENETSEDAGDAAVSGIPADVAMNIRGNAKQYPTLGRLIGGNINVKQIRLHWDEVLRLAASIKKEPLAPR